MPLHITRRLRTVTDVFNNDAFRAVSLTSHINEVPEIPRQFSSLGLVAEESIRTSKAGVSQERGVLRLVPSRARGEPGLEYGQTAQELVEFSAIYLPQEATIYADSLRDVLDYSYPQDQGFALEELINKLLLQMRSDMDATAEWRNLGLLRGKLRDANGSVLTNYYSKFGIAEPAPVAFDFSVIKTDIGAVKEKIDEIAARMRAIIATPVPAIHCFAGRGFFNALIKLEEIRDAYRDSTKPDWLRERSFFSAFEYGGCVFESYHGGARAPNGADVDFVAADEAVFFPAVPELLGGLLERKWTPAATFAALEQPGVPYYINVERDHAENPRWIKLLAESNPIDINRMPGACVVGVKAG